MNPKTVELLQRTHQWQQTRIAELEAHVRTLREALEYVWGELEVAEPIDVPRYQEAKRQTGAALAATEEGK